MRVVLAAIAASLLAASAHAAVLDDADLGAPVQAGNLTVFPLIAKAPEPDPGHLTLDEAQAMKALKIKEISKSGRVSTLKVTNAASEAVYLLAGEVLLGGKQDRIVARHTLVPAGAEGLEVSVFCVEHGRWRTGGSLEFASAKTLAHTRLRQQAQKGDQGLVWAEVADNNGKRKTANATDTYRAALSQKDLKKKRARLTAQILRQTRGERVAGVVVAVNGEVRGVDWFASPGLFRRLSGKLVESYVGEALDAADGKKRAASTAQARGFLDQVGQAGQKGEVKVGQSAVIEFDSEHIEGAAVRDITKPKARKAMHHSYFNKKGALAPKTAQRTRHRQRPQQRQRTLLPVPSLPDQLADPQ